MSRNRTVVVSLVVLAAVGLIAWPVYAHCGKCAGSAKEIITAMDAGKITLASAISAAETAAKGKAVSAHGGMEDGKLSFDVFVLAGDKLNRVEVDYTGKAGKIEEAKEFPIAQAAKKPAPRGG